MTKSHPYRDYCLDILTPFGDLTSRAMFGGHSLYKNGVIFAIIADETLYFKVDDSNRPDYMARDAEPFSYETKAGKKAVMSYWQVPLEVMEDSSELMIWAEKAYNVGVKAKK
jgi:DNA transformation protein